MRRASPARSHVVLGVVALGAAVLLPAGPVAGAGPPGHGRVGHNQRFVASVNGATGVAVPATIRMGCFGPLVPGQSGHPLAGQFVEVYRPQVIVAGLGFTGPTATTIQAFFGAPPPSPMSPAEAGAGAGAGAVAFSRYGIRKAIPTSLTLPCAGTGNVYFVPLPRTPLGPASDAVVHVAYVGQP